MPHEPPLGLSALPFTLSDIWVLTTEMPAQGGGATARDGSQHGEVLPGDPPAAAFDEGVSRAARTRSATSSGGRFIYGFCSDLSFSLSASSGLATFTPVAGQVQVGGTLRLRREQKHPLPGHRGEGGL